MTANMREEVLAELNSWDRRFDRAETIADNILSICGIDPALSAVPAPVSEEEIARERDCAQLHDELNEHFELFLYGNSNGDALRDALWNNKAGIIAHLSRLSRTEGEWRPDPKTVEACAKVADDAISEELDWDTSYWNQCCEQIAMSIRSLLDHSSTEVG